MGRGRIAAALSALAVVLLAALIYGGAYSIQADNSNFTEEAQAWLEHGRSQAVPRQVRLQKTLDIGNIRLALVELNGDRDDGPQLGLFRMKRGWNGRYSITGCGYGGGSLLDEAAPGGGYYLLGGRNRLFDIRSASFAMEKDGREVPYSADIPEGDYFLVAVEIDSAIEQRWCVPGSLRLYNGAGEDVTRQAE